MDTLKIDNREYIFVNDLKKDVIGILTELKLTRSGKPFKYVNITENKYFDGMHGTHVEAKGNEYYFISNPISYRISYLISYLIPYLISYIISYLVYYLISNIISYLVFISGKI